MRSFDVTAVEAPLSMLAGRMGVVFVPTGRAAVDPPGARAPDPLVLRAAMGDCVEVDVRNATDRAVSFEPDLMVFDPGERAVGRNGGAAIPPGGRRTSQFHAHPAFGHATVLVLDGGDPLHGPATGGYAAIAVAEEGAVFSDPISGEPVAAGWQVDVTTPSGHAYRDAVLFLQEQDAAIDTHTMPYRDDVEGTVGVNYTAAPLADRLAADPEAARVFHSEVHGDPPTPVIEAHTGDPIRLRVLVPAGEQGQVFTVEGHRWRLEQRPGSTLVSSLQLGALEAITIDLEGGAGGPARLPGDYVYGNHREPHREAGMWGLVRVHDICTAEVALRPLPALPPSCTTATRGQGAPMAALVAVAVAIAAGWVRRRCGSRPQLDRSTDVRRPPLGRP